MVPQELLEEGISRKDGVCNSEGSLHLHWWLSHLLAHLKVLEPSLAPDPPSKDRHLIY